MKKTALPTFALLLLLGVTASAQTTYNSDTTISVDTPLNQSFTVTNAATLTITEGATLSTGAGSAFIGGDGSGASVGTVALTSGTLSSNNAIVGQLSGSQGTVTLTGAGASWSNAAALNVGVFGAGSVSASGGATITSANGVLGGQASGTGTVTLTGTGTDWTTTAGVHIGETGTGSLTLSGGATMHNTTIKLGNNIGSTGTAVVTGAGTDWITTEFNIGYSGSGVLNLSDGARVNVNAGSGTVTLGNSGGTGTLNIGAAAGEEAAAAGIVNANTIASGSGTGTLQFNTTGTAAAPTYFTKDGTASGGLISTSGTIGLVHTAGTTVINGLLLHTGATTINGGTAIFDGAVSYSAITVNSGATLGGAAGFGGLITLNEGAHLAPNGGWTMATFSGGLTFNTGSILDFELGLESSDQILMEGGVLTGSAGTGGITLNLTDLGDFTAGTYTLISYEGTSFVGLELTDFEFGTTIAGYDYHLEWDEDNSLIVLVATAVPEPATWATLAGGAALVGALVRRRRRAQIAEYLTPFAEMRFSAMPVCLNQ